MDTWTSVKNGRDALAEYLAALAPDDWNKPSLCADWTVKDVAAHMLVIPTMSKGQVFRSFVGSGLLAAEAPRRDGLLARRPSRRCAVQRGSPVTSPSDPDRQPELSKSSRLGAAGMSHRSGRWVVAVVPEELPEDDLVVAGAVILPHSCFLHVTQFSVERSGWLEAVDARRSIINSLATASPRARRFAST